MSSVILYVNETDLKQSLNDRFREMHPQLPPSLTLSKIRNVKKCALRGFMRVDIEVSTVAIAVICFERLCMKGMVTALNVDLSMSVCLLLAFKFNDNVHVTEKYHARLLALLEFIDDEWEIPRSAVFEAEFGAFVSLDFSLHVPHQHIYLVYCRLLKLVHKTSRGYLGDEMDALYAQTVQLLETQREECEQAALEQQAQEEQKALANEALEAQTQTPTHDPVADGLK